MAPLVSILVPTHRDMDLLEKSLPVFLDRLGEFEVLVINNDPSQNVTEWAEARFGGHVAVLEMGYDAGFARAINRGIERSRGELVMFCNADLFASDTYLDEMIKFFEANPEAGAAAGKILRYEIGTDTPTDIIDTAGLTMGRNRRALVRGEGRQDLGQFEEAEEIFGTDGAALVVRRSALESIKIDDEYLDEDFFMYKEDWDLCWRLRLAGWECWYVPTAVASHGRTGRGLGETRYLEAITQFHRNERRKPELVRFHSMKNQWLMLVKNEDWYNFWRDAPHILGREAIVVLYNLIFSPKTLRAIPRFLQLADRCVRKRRVMQTRRHVSAQEMRRWFVTTTRTTQAKRYVKTR